jgi:hypothetical protein
MSGDATFWSCFSLVLLTILLIIPACVEIRRRRKYLSARVQSLVSRT